MTTFVFGAGASAHAGYPLTKDLGPKLLGWIRGNPGPANYIYWPDPGSLEAIGPIDDIEGFITKLEACEKPGALLAGLREALCHYFDSLKPPEAELYRAFANEIVRPGDVIISFNYDTSLEVELRRARKWEVSNGYGFDIGIPEMPKSPVKLLKLHGSTNWMDLLFGGLKGGQFACGLGDSRGERPVFPWGLDDLGYPGVKDPKWREGGVDRSGSMVLPSMKKKFYVETSLNPRERQEFWNSLWHQAAHALRRADRVEIIGYSLPPADSEARDLLLKNSNPRCAVSVCCGSDTDRIVGEFVASGRLHEKVSSGFRSFENWVASQGCKYTAPEILEFGTARSG